MSAQAKRKQETLDSVKGVATVVWEGDYFDPRDAEQLERFRAMQEEVGDRRMVIRTRRGVRKRFGR